VCVCVCVCVWFLFWNSHNDLLQIIGGIILFLLPVDIIFLFVQKQVIKVLSLFILLYIFLASIFLSSQDTYRGLFGVSDRSMYALYIGLSLSLITVLWAIIHTLVLRHREKKANQAVVK